MGRRKGLNYVQLLVSITPDQMDRLKREKNRSKLIRNLLDLYLEKWQSPIQEYRKIIADCIKAFPLWTESRLVQMAEHIDDPENPTKYEKSFAIDLRRINQLRQQIPKQLFRKKVLRPWTE